jgi:hypothetical protein
MRLRPREVIQAVESAQWDVVAVRGAFFLGMTGYSKSPKRLLRIVDWLDRRLSGLLPRLSSRVYVVCCARRG